MEELHDIIEFLENHGVEVFKPNYKKERFGLRCPYCGDSKNQTHFHMWVKYLPRGTRHRQKPFWGYRCNRCGDGGNLNSLLKKLGVKATVDSVKGRTSTTELIKLGKEIEEEKYESFIFGSFEKTQKIDPENLIYRPAFKRELFKNNVLAKQGIEYLMKRKLPVFFLHPFLKNRDIVIGSNPLLKYASDYNMKEMFGRIVFLSYNGVYAQGRLFTEQPNRDKYYIFRRRKAEYGDIIAFEGSTSKNLIIVEGPFDALRANLYGLSSVSIQGEGKFSDLEFSWKNFKKTREFIDKHSRIFIWLDKDVKLGAISRMAKNISRLVKKPVLICDIAGKYKEPDDVGSLLEWNNILMDARQLATFDGSIYEQPHLQNPPS